MRLIITTARGVPGARLSSPGNWGNRSFASVEDAEREARRLGATAIEREQGKRLGLLTASDR